MSSQHTTATRRAVLKTSGAALAALTTAGAASADHFHPDVTTEQPTNVTSYEATLEGNLDDRHYSRRDPGTD